MSEKKHIGVLVPYFNTTVQAELDDLRPPGITNQTARFTLDSDVLDQVGDITTKLLTCRPGAFLIGISTDPFPGGLELMAQAVAKMKEISGLPVVDASTANFRALQAIGAKRVGIVTPFDDEGNGHVRAVYEANGFEVVSSVGLACADLAAIPDTPMDEIREAFRDADHDDAEAIVHVGTGLPVLNIIEELEHGLEKTVIACNAASYWQALREMGVESQIGGFGRLLSEY